MILEEVETHPYRDDLFVDRIITPHYLVREEDKKIINRILKREFALEELESVL